MRAPHRNKSSAVTSPDRASKSSAASLYKATTLSEEGSHRATLNPNTVSMRFTSSRARREESLASKQAR